MHLVYMYVYMYTYTPTAICVLYWRGVLFSFMYFVPKSMSGTKFSIFPWIYVFWCLCLELCDLQCVFQCVCVSACVPSCALQYVLQYILAPLFTVGYKILSPDFGLGCDVFFWIQKFVFLWSEVQTCLQSKQDYILLLWQDACSTQGSLVLHLWYTHVQHEVKSVRVYVYIVYVYVFVYIYIYKSV